MTHPRDDENALVIPKRWHAQLLPRRGGTRARMAPPSASAIRQYRDRVAATRGDIDTVLAHRSTIAEYRDAAVGFLAGEPDPLGAAVVARVLGVVDRMQQPPTDAWISDHGAGFAATVLAELAGLTVTRADEDCTDDCRYKLASEHVGHFHAGAGPEHGIADNWFHRTSASALRQVRGWLAGMDAAAYRDTVDALAKRRRTPMQRLMVAFLVPTELAWVNQCCREVSENAADDSRQLLWCALSTAEQLDVLGGWARLERGRRRDSHTWLLVTLLDGLGIASLPVLAPILSWYGDLADRRRYAELVSVLPDDAALAALAAGLGDDKVQTAVFTTAMKRFPRRTARVLAAALGGELELPPQAVSRARTLLGSRLRTEPGLAAAITPDLTAAAAAAAAELAADADTGDAVPRFELPRLLTDPPWLGRSTARPGTVEDLDVAGEPRLSWADGEPARWRDLDTYEPALSGDWMQWVKQYRSHQTYPVNALRLLAAGPAELVEPLLPEWSFDADGYQVNRWTKKVVARFGLAAYGVAVSVARAKPTDCGGVLLPFTGAEVTTLMAGWLAAKTGARRRAAAWFTRHGGTAVELLLPAAVGTNAAERRNAEAALRFIARDRGAAVVHEVAARHGERVAGAIAALSLDDPLAQLPAKLPKPGGWAAPAALPALRRRADARRLPDSAVSHALTMLAMSSHAEHYAGWEVLREQCDPESLRRFCWGVFELWRSVGEPAPDNWALRQLSVFGDDDTVKRLLPVIMEWRDKAEYNSSNAGLDVLAAIGTDAALLELYRVCAKAGRKSFRQRAEQKLTEVAADRGIEAAELLGHLECRSIPGLGLDSAATMRLDYGPRGFIAGFDENLSPYIVDDQGRRIGKLPRATKHDDRELAKAAGQALRKLRKNVDEFTRTHLDWLESAMRDQRRFATADFFDLFTRHPLLSRIGRRLVWSCRHDGKATAFRIAEDLGFATVDEAEFTPPEAAQYSVAHPYELAADIGAWCQIFDDYELPQPFEQVRRPRYVLTGAERDSPVLDRLNGRIITQTDCDRLIRRGWIGGWSSTGQTDRLLRRVRPHQNALVTLTGTDEAAGAPARYGPGYRLTITGIRLGETNAPDSAAVFGQVDELLLEDLLHDLTRAAERAEAESIR